MKISPHTGGLGNRYGWPRKSIPTGPDAHDLKAAIDPAAFYTSENPTMPPTRRVGWVDGGLCPFHADKRRGSFRVNLNNGAFRCFACGAAGSDVVAFTMLRDGLAFREALAALAREWGVPNG